MKKCKIAEAVADDILARIYASIERLHDVSCYPVEVEATASDLFDAAMDFAMALSK